MITTVTMKLLRQQRPVPAAESHVEESEVHRSLVSRDDLVDISLVAGTACLTVLSALCLAWGLAKIFLEPAPPTLVIELVEIPLKEAA